MISVPLFPAILVPFYFQFLRDFTVTHDGFHDLLRAMENGDDVHITTNGSKLDSRAASAGWLIWIQNNDDDTNQDNDDNFADDRRYVDKRRCLMAGK